MNPNYRTGMRTIEFAVMLGRKYSKPPSAAKLMRAYGMSRATALRWVHHLAVLS